MSETEPPPADASDLRSAPVLLDGPAASYPRGETVHQAFLAVAAELPDTTALLTPDRSVTYAELAGAAHRVAEELKALGVGPGNVVPLLLPRSAELVAVLLGILMRGAAYAVLDHRWPQHRQQELIAILDPAVTVTMPATGTHRWTPPADLFGGPVPATTVVPEGCGDDGCSVFFTSGSTGTPKPVLSPHRATLRLFAPGATAGDFRPGSMMPQWAPLPWDGLTLELWSMLLTGGTALLWGDQLPTHRSVRDMVAAGADSVWLTSSLFNLIVDEDLDAFVGLRQVLTGGEKLSVGHVRRFVHRHPDITLINGYGPAEACVFATTHPVTTADCSDDQGIPLGRPVAGTSVVVLDGETPCAPGEVGEICVGGDGLAIGYLGDPELTARRFVEIQLGPTRTRLYRTGDRGFVGEDRLLRFVGRTDRQIKIRGFRIELGDVEAQLRRMGVTQAVVLADRDDTGVCTSLTAFYVPNAERTDQTPAELRTTLLAHLPRQFVPQRLLPVANIPLNANGKVDIEALSVAAEAERPSQATTEPTDAPGDAILAAVLSTVSAVTGSTYEPSARLDDGSVNSLDAMRVCMRLNERLGVDLGPQHVLDARSARELADLVRDAQVDSPAPVRTPADSGIPLADTQIGFLVEHETRPASRAGHCLIGWQVQGPFAPEAFRRALNDVQTRHPALRACYDIDLASVLRPQDGREVEFAALGSFDSVPDAWAVARADLLRPLEIDTGQVWRANWARTAADAHLLSLVIHHIAYDGWSESVLAHDLSVAYAARRSGGAPRFAGPLPDLAAALHDRVAEVSATSQHRSTRRYWANLLADLPEHDSIKGVSDVAELTVAVHSRRISDKQLAAADRLSAELGITRFPVLAAAYAAAVAEVLGEDDFGIGVPVSVRRQASQAEVITCLVDTICLRLRPEASARIAELARRAHEQMSLARGRHLLAFPDVVRAVNPPRQRGRNPLFRTMFVLQDNEPPTLQLEQTVVRVHRPAVPEPMSELLVEVWPDDDGARIDATFYQESVKSETVVALLDAFARRLALADHVEPCAATS
ncbi:amino acid adenylation domain-containing protein [Micromonospora sp. NPDC049051]|uniref:amino acid adenylation domain-containing protein n=1 Tax=Micromonospora sp. NPDC049051 TaxID=3364264 RepID=UPI00371512DE